MTDTQQVTAQYTWSSGVPPVSAGVFQSDSRNWSGATALYFSNADSQSQDLTATFGDLAVEDTIRAEQGGTPANWRVWRVTAPATQEADLSWTVPVASLDNGGVNVSNNRPCYLVFTLSSTPGQSLADWVMLTDSSNHWWSQVTCIHGTTTAGVWLNQPIQDDRNLEDQAAPAFANHQALHLECDCALNIAWTPSYVPPLNPEVIPVQASKENVPEALAGGSATFQIWASYPKLYGGRVTCPHGWAQSGAWRGAVGWPDLLQVRSDTYQNHQRLFGCGDLLAPEASTAAVTLGSATVARGLMQVVPEASGAVTGSGLQWTGSRLVVQQAGIYAVTASIALARSIPQGAGGNVHILLQGVSIAHAPMLQAGDAAVGTVAFSGQVAAGYTLRVGYENTTPMAYQDVQVGGTLNASSITVLAPS